MMRVSAWLLYAALRAKQMYLNVLCRKSKILHLCKAEYPSLSLKEMRSGWSSKMASSSSTRPCCASHSNRFPGIGLVIRESLNYNCNPHLCHQVRALFPPLILNCYLRTTDYLFGIFSYGLLELLYVGHQSLPRCRRPKELGQTSDSRLWGEKGE